MNPNYKPSSYNSVSPYLIVDGAAQTITFLVDVFSATELRRVLGPSGKIMHAELRVDDSIIMIADGAEGWPAVPSHIHIYVEDVDATYRLALEKGVRSVQEPVQKGDEDKRGGVKDGGGTTWWIATKKS